MRESEAASKVMILLSDGDNTAGNIDPVTAAELAVAYDIKIYTIGIGKEGKVAIRKRLLWSAKLFENTLDETTLEKLQRSVRQILSRFGQPSFGQCIQLIDEYEKAEIKETRYKNTTDFYPIYLKWS